MHHLPRFFSHRKGSGTMDRRKNPRRPRLERRNAAKHIEYDAGSSSSSLEDSTSSSSLHTRSLDLSNRTSFRVEGTDGEFDLICKSLGLSPEDFAIPAEAWEALKIRSSSDVLPRSRPLELDSTKREEVKNTEEIVAAADLRVRDTVGANIGDIAELNRADPAESSGCCVSGNCASGGGGNGIKGIRPPPVLKRPPAMKLPEIDHGRSTWELLKDFAPEAERGGWETFRGSSSSSSDEEVEEGKEEEEKGEEQGVVLVREKGEVEDDVAPLSESCSFTTSNCDDSSSSTTERMSNISPNGRVRPTITSWEKGVLLGRGSFGSVYEGISEDGILLAVKEVSLLDQGSQGNESVSQLEQEIALLSQFEHENIVQYYGTAKDESKLYIFLELVKGSLLRLYESYSLRDSQVSPYTRQILHGLKYLHDRNVVHRDIKCANILVDASGSVKLADFGLAKATKFNDLLSCKGTPFWMAPEVVNRRNQGYGLPADIWSLGCTVLEMLTRRIPYSDWEPMAALFKIGKGEPPPVPDSLSTDARHFILQCLQAKPDRRPTAAQLLDHPFVKRPLPTSSAGST
ncbi:mitogen-activated protein kinase kinase kinase 1 [Juglans microcarpa x Juglans regia]|uniref:mitogen-activated protein kinase kinase kinase 1 n=1 Tax=Juglans microcarpa x Juglans regia TaxID=2249226 RepID=UPI001B7F7175|nr:mitogen-activated protein kinase kinase kinase 1 [Juglans microcarpa x Juglans regia]